MSHDFAVQSIPGLAMIITIDLSEGGSTSISDHIVNASCFVNVPLKAIGFPILKHGDIEQVTSAFEYP